MRLIPFFFLLTCFYGYAQTSLFNGSFTINEISGSAPNYTINGFFQAEGTYSGVDILPGDRVYFIYGNDCDYIEVDTIYYAYANLVSLGFSDPDTTFTSIPTGKGLMTRLTPNYSYSTPFTADVSDFLRKCVGGKLVSELDQIEGTTSLYADSIFLDTAGLTNISDTVLQGAIEQIDTALNNIQTQVDALPSGDGVTNQWTYWSGTNTLSTTNQLTRTATGLEILDGNYLDFGKFTTASRPTGVQGRFIYDTNFNQGFYHDGTSYRPFGEWFRSGSNIYFNTGDVSIGTTSSLANFTIENNKAFSNTTSAFVIRQPNVPSAGFSNWKTFEVRSDGSAKMTDRYGENLNDVFLHINTFNKKIPVFIGRSFTNLPLGSVDYYGLVVSNDRTGTFDFTGSLRGVITSGALALNNEYTATLSAVSRYGSNNYTAAPNGLALGVYSRATTASNVLTTGGVRKRFTAGWFVADPTFSTDGSAAVATAVIADVSGSDAEFSYPIIATGGNSGFGTDTPNNTVDIAGGLRVSDLTSAPTRIVGADADGDIGEFPYTTLIDSLVGNGLTTDNFANSDLTFTGDRFHNASADSLQIDSLGAFILKGTGVYRYHDSDSYVNQVFRRETVNNLQNGNEIYRQEFEGKRNGSYSTLARIYVYYVGDSTTRSGELRVAVAEDNAFGNPNLILKGIGNEKYIGFNDGIIGYSDSDWDARAMFSSGDNSGAVLGVDNFSKESIFLIEEDGDLIAGKYGSGNKLATQAEILAGQLALFKSGTGEVKEVDLDTLKAVVNDGNGLFSIANDADTIPSSMDAVLSNSLYFNNLQKDATLRLIQSDTRVRLESYSDNNEIGAFYPTNAVFTDIFNYIGTYALNSIDIESVSNDKQFYISVEDSLSINIQKSLTDIVLSYSEAADEIDLMGNFKVDRNGRVEMTDYGAGNRLATQAEILAGYLATVVSGGEVKEVRKDSLIAAFNLQTGSGSGDGYFPDTLANQAVAINNDGHELLLGYENGSGIHYYDLTLGFPKDYGTVTNYNYSTPRLKLYGDNPELDVAHHVDDRSIGFKKLVSGQGYITHGMEYNSAGTAFRPQAASTYQTAIGLDALNNGRIIFAIAPTEDTLFNPLTDYHIMTINADSSITHHDYGEGNQDVSAAFSRIAVHDSNNKLKDVGFTQLADSLLQGRIAVYGNSANDTLPYKSGDFEYINTWQETINQMPTSLFEATTDSTFTLKKVGIWEFKLDGSVYDAAESSALTFQNVIDNDSGTIVGTVGTLTGITGIFSFTPQMLSRNFTIQVTSAPAVVGIRMGSNAVSSSMVLQEHTLTIKYNPN